MSLNLKEELAFFFLRYSFYCCSNLIIIIGQVSFVFLYLIVHFAVQSSLYQESASFYLLLKKNIYNSLTVN